MTECKYNCNEFCTNDQCPMRGDYCPVPDIEDVCRYEEREEVAWKLTPKGCLRLALRANGVTLDEDIFDYVWRAFEETMRECGYVEEDG